MTPLKILIMEDDRSIHMLYDKGLPDEACEKRFCTNGYDGLEEYKSWNPDIIVLDIYMPGMTGYSVLHTIRAEINDRATTIIMATSLTKKHDIVDCLRLGIQGYLMKPFSHKDVFERIMQYYQNHRRTINDSQKHDNSQSDS